MGPQSGSAVLERRETEAPIRVDTRTPGDARRDRRRAVTLLGLTEDTALGRPLHQHFRPSDATGFYADLAVYAQDSNEQLETQFALFKLGGWAVSIDTRHKADELVRLLEVVGAEAVFYQSCFAARIWEIQKGCFMNSFRPPFTSTSTS